MRLLSPAALPLLAATLAALAAAPVGAEVTSQDDVLAAVLLPGWQ
jgi:hypothetical protein